MKNRIVNPFTTPLLFLGAFALAVFVIMVEKGELPAEKEFPVGEPAPRSVFSPFQLDYVNEEATESLRKAKEAETLAIYSLETKVKPAVLSKAEETLKALSPSREFLVDPENQEKILKALTLAFERFLNEGILEDSQKKILLETAPRGVSVGDLETQTEKERGIEALLSVSEAKERSPAFFEKEGLRTKPLKDTAFEIFNQAIQPNLFFNQKRTQEKRKQARESVSPVMEQIKRGEMVTQRGLLVTPKQQQRLTQIQRKMAKRQTQNRLLTVSLFACFGLVLIFFYLRRFETKEMRSPRLVILTLVSLLVTLLIEKITLLIPGSSPYLLPGSLVAILLTLLWRPGLGLLAALAITIFSAPLLEFRTELVLMILFGSLVAGFVAHGVRKRIHFFRVGLVVGFVNAATLVAFFSFQDWPLFDALSVSALGFANGFLATALAFFLVPLWEALFNLTTDITLLELSDLNHPLLKRMVVEAPGTYHHSLVVSTLAEGACEAIGANALLARVGGYFHDIGKIPRSEYFTENQTPTTPPKHEKLTPTMSCLVIMNHVKDGIELAKKYKLKDVIVRFIPEHQGTGVVYYFYKKALDQASPGEKVNPEDFRYHGPKPQSRETAVVMLADSVEATSRSLKEITPSGIQTLVRKVINDKFIDGQLDECDLTLRDLHKIQESFVQNLMAIFHTRVSYPAKPRDPGRPDLFEENQFTKFRGEKTDEEG